MGLSPITDVNEAQARHDLTLPHEVVARDDLELRRCGLEKTRVDVLNAQQQHFVTRKDLAASRYQTLLACLQLKVGAGVLAESDFRALDSLLK